MRIVFMGTPDFAVPTLDALVEAGHDVVAAYSQPPRPGGRRGRELVPSPVQRRAEALGVPVRTPVSLRKGDAQAELAALGAEIGVVAAYGLILPQAVLDLAPHGFLNVHGSLLPRWRGAAPVQRAILAGDSLTGITIMQMEAGLDTGPMLATARVEIGDKTAGELTAELAEVGAQLMVGTLTELEMLRAVPQDHASATYAAKVDKAEARIDWRQPAEQIERQVRAFAPSPGAWFEFEGERYRVLKAELVPSEGDPRLRGGSAPAPSPRAGGDLSRQGTILDDRLTIATGEGALRPLIVQRAGRPAMDSAALLRGKPIPVGTRLG
jgi:methionyl-tRNA formyltransferase